MLCFGGIDKCSDHCVCGCAYTRISICKGIDEAVDTCITQIRKILSKCGHSTCVNTLNAVCQVHKVSELDNYSTQLGHIHATDAIVICSERLAERHQLFTEACNIVITRKPGYDATAIRQVIRKLNQSFSCICRVCNNRCIQPCYSQRVVLHCSTKRNKLLAKSFKVIVPRKPGYNSTCIWYRICKLKQSLTCGNTILNNIGFQSRNGIREILHCSAERNKLFTEVVHIIFTRKESDNTAAIRNGACHLCKRFTGCSRFRNHTGIDSSDFICEVTHGATKGNKLFAECVHVILSGKESNDTARIGKRVSHLCESLAGNCSIGNCFSINTANFIRELFHGFSERNHLFSKAGK